MKRVLLTALAALALLASAASPDAVRAADLTALLKPTDLRVLGGEGNWHPDNDFRLDWNPPLVSKPGFEIEAVHYRVRPASGGTPIAEATIPWYTDRIEGILVPEEPGVYTADVWLEGPNRELGPEVSAALRFDDVRPAPVLPIAPSGWVGANAAAVLRIEHPAGPLPISGIRGYAVAVDRDPGTAPCAGPDRCSLAETDLKGGLGGDTISLGALPEGVSVVRAVAVSGSGMRSAETGSAIVRVDATAPAVALEGAPPGWVDGPVRVTARATDATAGMDPDGPSGPFVSIAVDDRVPRIEIGDSAAVTVSGEGTHRLASSARDAAGNLSAGSPAVAAVRIDETPPTIAFSRAQDPAEPERIEAAIGDALAGIDPARGTIGVRPAGSHQRFEPLPTTTAGGRLVAHWDSDAFPPGAYELRATAYDAAGNASSSDRRAGGVPMVLANPLKAQTELAAGFGGRQLVWQRCSRAHGQRRCRRERVESFAERPTRRAVPYGRGIAYSGRLLAATGAPLGQQPVEVVETFAAGASSPRRTTTVRTATDGSFSLRLLPGPSREVEAVFAGNRTLTRAGGASVRLEVLAGVRLQASTASARIGGAPVVFKGQVGSLDAPIPSGGRPVELQFRVPGSAWSEFRTVQTDSQGRFHYSYVFADDDSRGVRFQFRAFAPAQDGWPYEPASSRPIFVTGR